MKRIISFLELTELKSHPDAALMLTKPERGFDYSVITFKSRAALEAFNKKANLCAVIPTQVQVGCAIYRHESDSEARGALNRNATS